MGFARGELLTYTNAFKNDFTTVIDNLPKDITLNPVTDPALQAIIDFVKDANVELAKLLSGTVSVSIPGVTTGLASSGGSGSNAGGGTGGRAENEISPAPVAANPGAQAVANVDQKLSALKSAQEKAAAQQKLVDETDSTIKKLNQQRATLAPNKRVEIDTQITNLNKLRSSQAIKLNNLNSQLLPLVKAYESARASVPKPSASSIPRTYMKDGGLVRGPGSGTSDSVNAMISNGEYVLRANAVKYYGADFMNSLNQMQVQRPGATAGSNVVYLSPDDRALLRAAIDRPIALYTENTRIAESANNGNVVLAQRGMK
jgi:hypothetical protein